MNIDKNVSQFIIGNGKNGGRNPDERYASFDYCYNYFQSFKEKGCVEKMTDRDNIQMSCLQLGFYLASWGMLRGSSFLLEKSAKHYEVLIVNIAKFDKRIWEIDVDCYTEDNIDLLLKCRDMICESLGKGNRLTDTLVTKVMLGIFANVPAHDSFFRRGFGVHSFSKKSLRKIAKFYSENSEIIDKCQIHTLDFSTGECTEGKYSKAKVIDMVGFMEAEYEWRYKI